MGNVNVKEANIKDKDDEEEKPHIKFRYGLNRRLESIVVNDIVAHNTNRARFLSEIAFTVDGPNYKWYNSLSFDLLLKGV